MLVRLYGFSSRTLTKRLEKKAQWELHKNAKCHFEEVLEAAPYKTAAVQPLISHLANDLRKTSKTYWTLPEKWERTYKWRCPADSNIWLSNLHKIYIHLLFSDAGYRLEDLPRMIADIDGERERESERLKESVQSACLDDEDNYVALRAVKYLINL